MTSVYRVAETFLIALLQKSEELRGTLKPLSDIERAKLVTEIVRDSDMVFGVWPSENEPEGFGVRIIKGDAIMPPFECFERDKELRVAAIPCVGLERALAARHEWGDSFTSEDDGQT